MKNLNITEQKSIFGGIDNPALAGITTGIIITAICYEYDKKASNQKAYDKGFNDGHTSAISNVFAD